MRASPSVRRPERAGQMAMETASPSQGRRLFQAALWLACLLAILGTPGRTLACGYHSPVSLARGVLNFTYPKSLHVSGAVWAAQRAGDLPMPDRERLQARGARRAHLDKIAFQKMLVSLEALGAVMNARSTAPDIPEIAFVLIESMLWTRYSSALPHIRSGLHARGPEKGDLVIVSEEVVLEAIVAGTLTIFRAAELGVMRFYGTADQKEQFLARFGSIGGRAMPVSLRMIGRALR